MSLEQGVEATCRRWRMFTPGTKVLVAVSGGPDSVALLLALAGLSSRLEISLGVAHLNHCIRGAAADNDEVFVRQTARDLGLPFHSARRDVPAYAGAAGMSTEEAARTLRYEFLRQTAAREGYARIAVGHTRDDQAETVLIALIRGSGVSGLGGMPPVLGEVVRPLIESSRQEVLAYLELRGAPYCHDLTNEDLAHTRNRVRHVLLPLLEKEFNPGIRTTLARNALIVQDEDAWLAEITREFLDRCTRTRGDGRLAVDRAALAEAPVALLRRALREAAARVAAAAQQPAQLGSANVEDLVAMLAAGRTGARIDLPGGLKAELGYGELTLRLAAGTEGPSRRTAPLKGHGVEYRLPVPGAVRSGGRTDWDITAEVDMRGAPGSPGPGEAEWLVCHSDESTGFTAYLDLDRLAGPLHLRTRRLGDRFWPHGAPAETKLKDFLIAGRVPRAVRDALPLLCDGSGRICAVLPLRAADWATVGPGTQRVLVLKGRIVTGPGVDREHRAW